MKKGLFTLLLLIITALPALAATDTSGPWGIWVSKGSGFTSFSTAKRSPVTANKTMVVAAVMPVNNLTAATDRAVEVKRGGGFNVAAGKTLDMNGITPIAGRYQIFFGAGTVINVKDPAVQWFGAVGNGVADDDPPIQKTINSASAGSIIDGGGKANLYLAKHCQLKSNIEFQNFYLKTAPGAPVPVNYLSPAADFWSPVTIGAYDDVLRENIIIRNVHVDGNRVNNNTGIVGAEDGAKHGFRLIGKLKNILVENSSARYCGSYGIILGLGLTVAGSDVPNVTGVTLRNFVSQYNKIHGGAADSIQHLSIENSQFTHNGHAYSTDPAGQKDGDSYGNGIDFEGYGIGSWLGDIKLINSDFRFNANNSITVTDTVTQTDTGFVARKGFDITNCDMDTGSDATRPQPTVALQFSSTIPNKALAVLYNDITITGGSIAGEIVLRSVANVQLNVPVTTTTAYLGVLDYVSNIIVGGLRNGKAFSASNSTYAYTPELTSMPQLTSNGALAMNGLYVKWVASAATAFTAGQEQSVTATLPESFPNGTLFVVPTISAVSASSDLYPPRNAGGTTTTVSAVVKNGATPQNITVGFWAVGY